MQNRTITLATTSTSASASTTVQAAPVVLNQTVSTTTASEATAADGHRISAAEMPVAVVPENLPSHRLNLTPTTGPASQPTPTTTTAIAAPAGYPDRVASRSLIAHLKAPGIEAPVYDGDGLSLADGERVLEVGASWWHGDQPCSSVGPTEILAHRTKGPGLFRTVDRLVDGDTIDVATYSPWGDGRCTYSVFNRVLLPVAAAEADLRSESRPGVLVLVACAGPQGEPGPESYRWIVYAKIN